LSSAARHAILAVALAVLSGCAVPPPAPIRWHPAPPAPPIRTEPGNLWPGPPKPTPTLLDLQNQGVRTVVPLHPRPRGGAGLCGAPAAPGMALGLCYTPP